MTRICPNGHMVNDSAKFCPKCGIEVIDSGAKFCKKCGRKRNGTEKYCSMCGNSYDEEIIPQSNSNIHDKQQANYVGSEPEEQFYDDEPNKILYYIIGVLVVLLIIGGIILFIHLSDGGSIANANPQTSEQAEKEIKSSHEESNTPQKYVYLSGILNVETVEFKLYHDYGNTYKGTFYNSKLGLTMKIEGKFVAGNYFKLYSTDQKSTWKFACDYNGNEYSGTASNGRGASYNMNVK